MTEEQTLICEHGLRAAELSAWRDGDLSESEMSRVGDHLAECPTARARLADYDAVIAALRAQRVPLADQRLWQSVSNRSALIPVRHAHRRRLTVTLGMVGTIAALLALVLGFARLFLPGPPSQSASRGWDAATFPPGFTVGLTLNSLAVVDGATAYVCITPFDQQMQQKPDVSGTAAQFWVTHNRGRSWTRRADLPLIGINQCEVTTDALAPNVVAVWGHATALTSDGQPISDASTASSSYGSVITYDGGATWQQPAGFGDGNDVTEHATIGATTYAIICCGVSDSEGALVTLDNHSLTTAPHSIGTDITTASQQILSFSISPSGKNLLVVALNYSRMSPSSGTNANEVLWQSTSGGTHWTPLSGPAAGPYDSYAYVVQQPIADHDFKICAEVYPPVDPGATSNEPIAPTPSGLSCSYDSGTTWQSVKLPPRAACPPPTRGPVLQAIASNGDLYMDDGGCTDTLYRLPFKGDSWQAVATAPSPRLDLDYYPDANVVWTMPRLFDGYTQVDPTGTIYTKPLAV